MHGGKRLYSFRKRAQLRTPHHRRPVSRSSYSKPAGGNFLMHEEDVNLQRTENETFQPRADQEAELPQGRQQLLA